MVVYGLSSFHEERNTADPRLDYWAAISSTSHSSSYPRCHLIENSLVRDPPKVWDVIIPLTGQLVLSKVLTDSVLSLLAIPRVKEQRQITEHLLLSLNKATQESHGNFIVLLQDLSGESLSHYRDFLRNAQINYIDGSSIAADNQSKLPDGHPGPDMTQLWANQLAEYITTNYAAIPISRLAN